MVRSDRLTPVAPVPDRSPFRILADAMKVPNGDWLGRQLSAVPQLVAGGYDDAHRKSLPLIVS